MEVGRDLKGRETRVRRWMRDRFLQNNFILYICQLQLLYFFYFLSVNCLLLIFFCCLICVDFFLLSFVCFFLLNFASFFVGFGELGLLCHLLCCLLLFVYFLFIFYFLIYFFYYFYLHGFSGFIFFVSLIALGTSSLRLIVFPRGVGCTGTPFRGLVSRGSKLYK